MSLTDELSADAIRYGLRTQTIGQVVDYYPQIGSTNEVLKALADQGAPEGKLVITDEQIQGKGRFARRWQAPPRSSLLMSLLFRPTFLAPNKAQQLTMLCALAAVEAIAEHTSLTIGLKWPNDLVYGEKKLAGVLTELGVTTEGLGWVVVGMGLNVNWRFDQLKGTEYHIPDTATSLCEIVGHPVPRLALLQSYLTAVEQHYEQLRTGRSPHIAWSEKLVTLNQQVTVTDINTTRTGIAEAVSDEGALIVRFGNGNREHVVAGDVTLKKQI